MRRALRGLALVPAMLWLAASAGAFTMWNGDSPLLLRSSIDEDYGGVLSALPDDPGSSYARRSPSYAMLGLAPSYQRRGLVPYDWGDLSGFGRRSFLPASPSGQRARRLLLAPGLGRLGRRDLPVPVFPVLVPNRYLPVGRLPESGGNEVFNVVWRVEDPLLDPILERSLADPSWRAGRDLLVQLLPYPVEPLSNFLGGGGATLVMLGDLDRDLEVLQVGDGGSVLRSLPELEERSSFGGSVEWRADRLSIELEDFGSASAAVSAAPIPEPATGALLLAGLCALAACRRRR